MEHQQIEQINFEELWRTLTSYKKVLTEEPTHVPQPGIFNQFEFWNDNGEMKLCFYAQGEWHVSAVDGLDDLQPQKLKLPVGTNVY